MKISVELEVKYDAGFSPDLEELDEEEISDEISGAVSGCAGIESVASVEVKRLKLKL